MMAPFGVLQVPMADTTVSPSMLPRYARHEFGDREGRWILRSAAGAASRRAGLLTRLAFVVQGRGVRPTMQSPGTSPAVRPGLGAVRFAGEAARRPTAVEDPTVPRVSDAHVARSALITSTLGPEPGERPCGCDA